MYLTLSLGHVNLPRSGVQLHRERDYKIMKVFWVLKLISADFYTSGP